MIAELVGTLRLVLPKIVALIETGQVRTRPLPCINNQMNYS
jgi:hypothetical protein